MTRYGKSRVDKDKHFSNYIVRVSLENPKIPNKENTDTQERYLLMDGGLLETSFLHDQSRPKEIKHEDYHGETKPLSELDQGCLTPDMPVGWLASMFPEIIYEDAS